MENKLIRMQHVPASRCDRQAKLGAAAIMELFMDMATEHSEVLHIGRKEMLEQHFFWLAVKNSLRIHRRPDMTETVELSTWPEKPGSLRCHRDYRMRRGEELLCEAVTEWVILDTDTGRVRPLQGIYPVDIEHAKDTVEVGEFTRMKGDFTDAELLGAYTVGSNDIDYGGHMNNVAYVRALLSLYSCDQREARELRELEVSYKNQAFEGDVLTFRQRKQENVTELAALLPDGRIAAQYRLVF